MTQQCRTRWPFTFLLWWRKLKHQNKLVWSSTHIRKSYIRKSHRMSLLWSLSPVMPINGFTLRPSKHSPTSLPSTSCKRCTKKGNVSLIKFVLIKVNYLKNPPFSGFFRLFTRWIFFQNRERAIISSLWEHLGITIWRIVKSPLRARSPASHIS